MDEHVQLGAPSRLGPRRFTPIASWRRRRELRSARERADAEILSSNGSANAGWRVDEVTAMNGRRALARSVRRLVRSADARYLAGASPLNRLAVRDEAPSFQVLADLLEDPERPVSARGVLLLDRLLSDEDGPLYVSYRARELRSTLASIGESLEAAS